MVNMRYRSLLLAPVLALAACRAPVAEGPDYNPALLYGADALIPLGPDEIAPNLGHVWLERDSVMPALEHSIRWTRLPSSGQHFPMAKITHERALQSLERFRVLLEETASPEEFSTAIDNEFQFYKSAGWDSRGGGVLFTGYCTPILEGSLVRSPSYPFPLYGLPDDLEKAPDGTILGQRTEAGLRPYPTRSTIEANSLLEGQGLELVWLRDPIDAFIAHVNGSAIVRLPDGSEARFGYAGKNGRPYTSLGGELIKDGQVDSSDMNLSAIRTWASRHPGMVDTYLHRNDSYVFFTAIDGNPRGSLNVPVSTNRTLATDKSLFPRGALVYVDTMLPLANGGQTTFRQLMLDQDTGGAIRTAGRADIYLGIGREAERRAGATRSEGQLYYLFLR